MDTERTNLSLERTLSVLRRRGATPLARDLTAEKIETDLGVSAQSLGVLAAVDIEVVPGSEAGRRPAGGCIMASVHRPGSYAPGRAIQISFICG